MSIIPLLVGGALVLLIGTLMTGAAAFAVSPAWGVLCLFPPLQVPFALMNLQKSWDGLLLQGLGLAMILGFFIQAGDFGSEQVAQEWVKFQRQYGLQGAPTTETAVVGSQPVQGIVAPTAGGPAAIQSLEGNAASVTVVAGASKEVDDKPIYKCTDPQGNETYSRKACAGSEEQKK